MPQDTLQNILRRLFASKYGTINMNIPWGIINIPFLISLSSKRRKLVYKRTRSVLSKLAILFLCNILSIVISGSDVEIKQCSVPIYSRHQKLPRHKIHLPICKKESIFFSEKIPCLLGITLAFTLFIVCVFLSRSLCYVVLSFFKTTSWT